MLIDTSYGLGLFAKRAAMAFIFGMAAACTQPETANPAIEQGTSTAEVSEQSSPPETPYEPDAAQQNVSADEEELYLDRFERMIAAFSGGGSIASIYDTLDQVRGAATPVLLPRKSDTGLTESARLKAIEYAEARKSAALMVIRNGDVILETYFGENDSDSLINGKSLAKPLGALAIGRAIMDGHIHSLEQPASDFLTEWQGTPKEAITIRQLLGMRSGLAPQSGGPSPDHIMNRAYLHPRHDEIIINAYPLENEPGTRYDYSNANAELIAPIIERATGQDYASWVSAELIAKLDASGGDIWINRSGGVAHSGCCILLPAETFAKLGLLVMQDGAWGGEQLLPEGYSDAMRQSTPENIHAGLGIYLGHPYKEHRGANNPDSDPFATYHSAPYARDDLYLFDGNSNQVVYMIPSEDLLILRVGDTPSRELPWDNAVLPNLILEGLSD